MNDMAPLPLKRRSCVHNTPGLGPETRSARDAYFIASCLLTARGDCFGHDEKNPEHHICRSNAGDACRVLAGCGLADIRADYVLSAQRLQENPDAARQENTVFRRLPRVRIVCFRLQPGAPSR